jgi:hypothetical protein
MVQAAAFSAPLKLELKQGARGQPGSPGAGSPGAPGGDPNGGQLPPQPSQPPAASPGGLDFGDVPSVRIGGSIKASKNLPIKIDLFKVDAAARGGRSFLGKVEASGGRWEAKFPKDFGPIEIQAYQDLTGDGPTGDDPQLRYSPSPVTIGTSALTNLDIALP